VVMEIEAMGVKSSAGRAARGLNLWGDKAQPCTYNHRTKI